MKLNKQNLFNHKNNTKRRSTKIKSMNIKILISKANKQISTICIYINIYVCVSFYFEDKR
jgi:hypothetical protein